MDSFEKRQPDTIDHEARSALIEDLSEMLLDGNATDEAMMALIKERSREAFGKYLNDEEVRQVLMTSKVGIVLAKKIAEGGEFSIVEVGELNLEEEERPQEPINISRSLYFAISHICLLLRARVISACPVIADRFMKKFTSGINNKQYSIHEVMRLLGGVDGLASEVINIVKLIQAERESNPEFLPKGEIMEFLRMVLFLARSLGLKDKMLCDFGQEIFRDLSVYVADYEKKCSQRSAEGSE